MKVNFNLGVTKAKDLRESHECFKIGREATRVQDGLVFAEFYFKNPRKVFTKQELEAISAGIHSSANVANRFKLMPVSGDVQEKAKRYASSAEGLNKKVRAFLLGKDGSPMKKFTQGDKAVIEAGLAKLNVKARHLGEEAEKLCYLEKKVKLAPPMKKRVMAGPIMRAAMGASRIEPIAPAPAPLKVEESSGRKTVYPTFSRPAFHKNRRKW